MIEYIKEARPWEDLREAIVMQAVKDIKLYQRHKSFERLHNSCHSWSPSTFNTAVEFFTSEWFDELFNHKLDGEDLLRRILEDGKN